MPKNQVILMSDPAFSDNTHMNAYKEEFMRAPILHYPPLWVTLGICSPCPYHCQFCAYHSLDARKISKVYNVPFTMPLNQAKSLVDFFHDGAVPHIHICGTGEPLYHPDFFQILDYVIEKYGKVSFQSNFPPELVKKQNAIENINKRAKYISGISLDLMDNPDIKGGKIGEIYRIIKQLKLIDPSLVQGSFLLTRKNWRDLEHVVRSTHTYDLHINVKTVRVFPHNINEFTNPINAWNENLLTEEEKAGLQQIGKLAKLLGVRLYLFDPKEPVKCDVFWKKLQIWPTRSSLPGRLDNIIPHACNAVVLGDMNSLGYVHDYHDVHSLWNNPDYIKIRQNLLSGIFPDKHCKNCPNAHFHSNL